MNLKSIGSLALLAATLIACDRNRVQVSDTGLKYQMHDDDEGTRLAKVGDILTLHLTLKNSKDSVLRDTHKENVPMKYVLQAPMFKGSFEEGLAMLSKGDSATFFVSADSIFSKNMQPLPPGVAKGSDIAFTVKLLEVQNEEEYTKAQASAREKQKVVDEKVLVDYVTKNGLNAQKTASGVRYVITQPGTGPAPARGDMVKVKYTGKLLNGKEFDSSAKDPRSAAGVEFPLGMGQVIPGWEEGIMQMRKGGKGTLIIPSVMAYGADGVPGAIPPNSVILFDVELVDVQKGAGLRQMQQMQQQQMQQQQQQAPQGGN